MVEEIGLNRPLPNPGRLQSSKFSFYLSRMLLAFDGVSRPVELIGAENLVECLSGVLRGWRFPELRCAPAAPPIITVRKTAKGYTVESPWRSPPSRYRDEVDVVCTFIVDLIRAYIADAPSLLCLHGAAAEFAGKLVIFPNPYRAGKSTLTAYLAAAGVRVYTDDMLPIRGRGNRGVAPGIAPRLRLPLPSGASAAFRDYVERRRGLGSRRYLYLDLGADELAPLGTHAPIGGFVLLRRDSKARPELAPARTSDVLKRVILQHFARDRPAVEIFRRLNALVGQAQCFTLRYADGEHAVALLKEAFGRWPSRRRRAGRSRAAGPAAVAPAQADRAIGPRFRRNEGVTETAIDRDLFLVNPGRQGIYHLNATGAALWRLLAEPIGVEQAVAILHHAFPDVARAQIERDVTKVMADLTARGLITDAT